MQPRSYWTTMLVTAPVTAVLFALGWSLSMSLMLQVDFVTFLLRTGLWAGLAFGIFFTLMIAVLQRVVRVSIPFRDKAAFLMELQEVLTRMHYKPDVVAEDFWTFKPTRGLFKPDFLNVRVQLEDRSATLVGPWFAARKIQRRFRA